MPIVDIFCLIDDFCKHFHAYESNIQIGPKRKKTREPQLTLSEIMTIVVLFHRSGFKTFKEYYQEWVLGYGRSYFPKAVTYHRFVELMPRAFMPLVVLSQALKGKETGKYFVDSAKLSVCHNLRINRHKVFKGLASRGKTSTGWFFGFKLHFIINDKGEIMSFALTPGHTHDTKTVKQMAQALKGWIFGDKGYLSQSLSETLEQQGLLLFTRVRKNMEEKLMTPLQKLYLSRRGLIETVIDQLKAICSMEHSRHRSPNNFLVNFVSSLIAYTCKYKKPSLNFSLLIPN